MIVLVTHFIKGFICLLVLNFLGTNIVYSQVEIKDSVVTWRHHAFDLNPDGSINTFTTADDDIQEVTFNVKVIENKLIRLVLLPEYGGRVLSYYYKPTQHEYLYQSECGSAYGIYNDIFYYDWLMVYGGIFPTFPEPEHGKTWFLPWDFSIIEESSEQVTIRMEYTDDTEYDSAPWNYNNGITNLTCQVDVSVYENTSLWDFDVKLINDKSTSVNYEYWTCTTLAPGSDPEDTGTPLNTEIVIPVEKYFAAWSPGGWIGNNNQVYDFDQINDFEEWQNMGIAYAHEFEGKYWGVINHENEEGIFRLSENTQTKGVKLWTWGKNNIDNDLYDWSNEGADNYVELWAGVSDAFFIDAIIPGNSEKEWKETYCATVNMPAICEINNFGAVNMVWDNGSKEFSYYLNTFHSDQVYTVNLNIEGNGVSQEITSHSVDFEELGQGISYFLGQFDFQSGEYSVYFDLIDTNGDVVLNCVDNIVINTETNIDDEEKEELSLRLLANNEVLMEMEILRYYEYKVYSVNGQLVTQGSFYDESKSITIPSNGLYIVSVEALNQQYNAKIFIP